MNRIREWILRWAQSRTPDFIIGGHERPYLRRWWLIPRNFLFNVYVHEFLRSDDDRALHDHPWLFNATWMLEGLYREHTAEGRRDVRTTRKEGDWKFRWGPAPHRIELAPALVRRGGQVVAEHPCWTVFITGPRVREWGFLCPRGWVPWQEFTDARDSGSIGKGCD